MKIGIISDTHDNLANFKKIIDWLKKEGISFILHCGDIASPDTLKKALEGFSGKFLGVLGNADNIYQFDLKDYQDPPRIKVFEKTGELKLDPVRGSRAKGKRQSKRTSNGVDDKRIAFTHYPWEAKKLAKSGKYDLVFYGHTHKPWQRKIGNCLLVNPGNGAGIMFRPTFAVYDTEKDKLELKILDKL